MAPSQEGNEEEGAVGTPCHPLQGLGTDPHGDSRRAEPWLSTTLSVGEGEWCRGTIIAFFFYYLFFLTGVKTNLSSGRIYLN